MKEWLAAICGETWWRKKRERKMRWQAASRYPLPEREQLEQYLYDVTDDILVQFVRTQTGELAVREETI